MSAFRFEQLLKTARELLADHQSDCANLRSRYPCPTCAAILNHCADILSLIPPQPIILRKRSEREIFSPDDVNWDGGALAILKEVPETKTYEHVGVDQFGRRYGWIKPGALDPYSEPYLAVVESEQ